MMCMKNIRKVCCQLANYAVLVGLCVTTATITTIISQRSMLPRDHDVSSRDIDGIRLTFDLSVTSVLPSKKQVVNAVRDMDIPLSDKESRTNQNVDVSHKEHVILKTDRKLSHEPVIHEETDSELLAKYNVTPDSKGLRQFYQIDSAEKRKSLFDFPFIIDGSKVCEKSRDPFLLVMVLSVHTHIDTREAIRNTWGRAANPGVWPKVGALRDKVKLIFLFGRGDTPLKNTIVRDESKIYNDIVQADFVDSYFNLSYKVVTGVRWVSQFCPGAKYILKADEDVFVHVSNLIEMLKNQPQTDKAMFYGHTHDRAVVLRRDRWKVAPRSFPFPVYPSYTCGNTYVIPGSKALDIYRMAGYLEYMNIEDVFVTGILRTMIGAGVRDIVGFTNWYEKKPIPCEFKNTIRISATRVTDSLQTDIWEGLRSNIANCYKPVLKKVNIVRPEHVVQYKPVVRDEHIYFNKTNKKFYSVG